MRNIIIIANLARVVNSVHKKRENADDVIPFIMKNYYHAHKRQYDDATDIWFAHDEKPVVYNYEVVEIACHVRLIFTTCVKVLARAVIMWCRVKVNSVTLCNLESYVNIIRN